MLSDVRTHYGFTRDFNLLSQISFFETAQLQLVLKELKLAIKDGKLIVLSGMVGTGKTSTLQRVQESLEREKEILVAQSLALNVSHVTIETLELALFCDLATEKDEPMPKKSDDTVNALSARGIGLKSLNDPIDTTTPQGRLVFNMFASLAEFERDLIRERTQAGLSAARARGRQGGRPKGLPTKSISTAHAAETLYREGKLTAQQIADQLHISKSTLYAYLRYRGVAVGTSALQGR